MKMLNLIIVLFCFFIGINAFKISKEISGIGDRQITIFEKEPLYFDMALKESKQEGDILRIDAGRILLKKVILPKYEKDVKINVRIELTSTGDPWDKTGSLFVIPKNGLNFLEDEKALELLYKEADLKDSNFYPAINPFKNYLPAIELMRFYTPFGVGHFSKTEKAEKYKPVYIPKWEDKVVWNQDVSHLVSELENEVWIGVFIDTWTKEGYNIDVKLEFTESTIKNHLKEQSAIIPLVNTVRYIGPQRLYDGFSKQNISTTFEIPENCKSAELYYITTGHGGHSEGDEFTQKENLLVIDGDTLYQKTPWRDDCASFRRFNPSSGVWTEKRNALFYDTESEQKIEKEIDEIIASSDYSRSNWCPGLSVSPHILNLSKLSSGKHQLTVSIPEAQAASEDKHNHWNVSVYIKIEW